MSQKGWFEAPCTLLMWEEGPKRDWTTDRKLRLWACACARRIWELLPDKRSRRAIEVAERFADGLATEKERAAAFAAATAAKDSFEFNTEGMTRVYNWAAHAAEFAVDEELPLDWENMSFLAAVAVRDFTRAQNPSEQPVPSAYGFHYGSAAEAAHDAAQLAQADFLRDVFGNPFRPVKVKPAWLTADVLALARGIYDEKAFDRMPILADALQDAGCDNDDVLNHCRDADAIHVRGCWVVDLLLGKK